MVLIRVVRKEKNSGEVKAQMDYILRSTFPKTVSSLIRQINIMVSETWVQSQGVGFGFVLFNDTWSL